MPNSINCLVKIFADDTKAYSSVNVNNDFLQSNLDKLVKWTDDWQINFNRSKCKVLHTGKNNPRYKYYIDGKELDNTAEEKDLGVVVDENLNFNSHINQIVKKANRMSGMIVGNIQCKDIKIMVPLFKSLVRPILEYGNAVWSPSLRKHINLIENVQRRFTKKIVGISNQDYEKRLQITNLPSLEFRRLRGDMIETFKLTHGFYDPITSVHLITMHENKNTRGHPYKLAKQLTHTSKFAHFFSNRIVNAWNNLPLTVVNSDTINTFKNRLDKHWKFLMYSSEIEID